VDVAADDSTLLRLVRLVITNDWDAGFQLTPSAEPLSDVPPGGECEISYFPDHGIAIRDVLVRGAAALKELVDAGREGHLLAVTPDGPRGPAFTVQAGAQVIARLRNDGPVPLRQKVPSIVRENLAAVKIDPAPTGRAEDAVACPACGNAPGTSCDGPASHPSRHRLYVERIKRLEPTRTQTPVSADWIVEDVKIGSAGGPAGLRNLRKEISISARCPTCEADVRGSTHAFCQDVWHEGPVVHAPQIARTMRAGPGNATLVRGCTCGADITSVSAFADHVGVPRDAMRSIFAIVGIAIDLIEHPKQMDGREARRQIERCLEFTR